MLALGGCGAPANAPSSSASDTDSTALTVYVLQGFDPQETGVSSSEYLLRQAGALFEERHPGATVNVTVGIPANGGLTTEDAIRALNAELAAGEGPDVLVLDGLPLEQLAAQERLQDLTSLKDGLGSSTYFTNIVQAAGGSHAVPVSFSLPLVAGSTTLVSQAQTASDLATLIAEDPAFADALATGTGAQELLAAFYPLLIENGTLNQEALVSFLSSTKAVLLAASERWHALNPESNIDTVELALQNLSRPAVGGFSGCDLFLEEGTALTLGSLSSAVDYAYLLLEEEQAPQPCTHKPLAEGTAPVFTPHTLLGINAATAQPGLAEDFVAFLLSDEVQENLLGAGMSTGIPVNKSAFTELNTEANGYSVSFMDEATASKGEGGGMEYSRGPLSAEEMTACVRLIESATTSVAYDQVIVDALAEAMHRCCNGTATAEEAAEEAARVISLRLEA
ncbi:MAG: ABC transporter substrate-binding protein [Adlercreutzia sp.]|nr:ABC transporter substrate-binding protein [Adlercreutzia sp.]